MNIALITGASSGLGAKFIEAVAGYAPELDEIWLVARRGERMEAYAAGHPEQKLRIIALDLTREESYGSLKELLEAEQACVRILVNNAGYEKSGRFDTMAEQEIRSIVDLNVRGFTMVNRVCAPHMDRGSIGVMTCSVTAFAPVPFEAVYSASKAYVQHFSRAFREEMGGKGVHILMLCPGNLDTEMNPKGEGRQSKRISMLPYLDMEVVTRRSLALARRGRAVYTPGVFYKGYRLVCKVLPKAVMGKVAAAAYR